MSRLRGSLWFLLRKLGSSLVTVIGLATLVFVMVKLIPGDEAHVAAGESASPAQVAAVRQRLGLDDSLPVQYGRYLDHLLHGDLGTSITTHQAVSAAIGQVLPGTIELVLLALALVVTVAVPAATVSAMLRGRPVDSALRVGVIVAAGMPTFWLGLVLQFVLGARLGLLPISGRLSLGLEVPRRTGMTTVDALLAGNLPACYDAFQHLLLPAAVLAVPFGAQVYRTLRAELLSVLGREHLVVARAKGLTQTRLILRHALPNAMNPVITLLGILAGVMVGAAVLVESIFGLSGVGAYLTSAVAQKDTFAVLGGVLVIGTVVVAVNFLVDVVQLARDPRIRVSPTGA